MQKKSSRAKLNISLNKSQTKNVKKSTSNITKQIKNASGKTIALCLLFLVIGFAIGFAIYSFTCKNDCFEIVGNDEITLTLNDKYIENGVKIIEFGKDISSQVNVETNLVLDENGFSSQIGTFYVKYSVDSIKYGKIFKIEKIKLVTFVYNSEGGE